MNVRHYDSLNVKGEDSFLYRRRLQAFPILHRFDRSSNYIHVADQIVTLNLVNEFMDFTPSQESFLPKKR